MILTPGVVQLPTQFPYQREKLLSPARHAMWIAGRRARKSTTAAHAAICGRGPRREFVGCLEGGNIWWISPVFSVGLSAWRMFRGVLAPVALEVSEANKRILLPGGGAITVRSADHPASLVGDMRGLDGVVLDEAAQFDPAVWFQAIRPALADRRGWSFFASTPRGFNYLEALFRGAKDRDDWQTWQEPSTINPAFDPAEIERAIAEGMPASLVAQEFYAQWVSPNSGRAFYEFNAERHVSPVEYLPGLPVELHISFRGDPPAMLVVQVDNEQCHVIEEITSDTPSTRDLIEAFQRKYPRHADGSNVKLAGDCTPGAGGKSVGFSDFEPFRKLMPRARHHVMYRAVAPKDLLNVTNEALRGPGEREYVKISPSCSRLIRDLESLETLTGTFAVDTIPGRGHFAFALAFGLRHRFPLGIKWPAPPSNLSAMDLRIQARLKKGRGA